MTDAHDRTGRPGLRCSPGRFALCCAATSLLSLWIRSGVPASALALAGEDDALFVRLARSLASGHWLGPFDDLTLVKGIAYPAFIAAAFWAGVPLKLAEQGVYLASCLLAAALVRRAAAPECWAPAAVFAVLALDPILWSAELARVIREGLYIGLSPALLVLSAWVSFGQGRGRAAALGGDLLLGLVGAAFWLTREEGVWLLPALAVNAACGAAVAWRRRDRRAAARAGASWAMAALVFAAVVSGVAALNQARYGAFEVNEVQSLPFRRAYGALARIRPEAPRRFVVFPKDARDAAYAVSPAARELAPVLDGPLGDARRRAGCAEAEVEDCPEILAGWFQWAFRDAVAAAGHYGSAASAAAFYTRLADEIDAACARGALSCLPPRATLAPPFRWDDVALAARTFPRLAAILAGMGAGSVGALPSDGPEPALAAMADMVGSIAPPARPATEIRGWAAGASGPPTLQPGPQEGALARIETGPAPDIARAFPAMTPIRFALDAAGSGVAGDLVIATPGRDAAALPLASLLPGATLEAAGATLHVDSRMVSSAAGDRRRDRIVAIGERIAAVYAALVPAACLLACFGIAAAVRWRRHAAPPPAMVALALSGGVGVLCRLALLSYLDATAIPAVNNLYPSPASPLLLLFAALGCWLGAAAAWARATSSRRGGTGEPRTRRPRR